MIDELVTLLWRQAAASERLERRLRALELVVVAEESRFVSLARDEVEQASEELAALELTRALALSTAGIPVDVTAADLSAAAGADDDAARLRHAGDELRTRLHRVEDARRRARAVVAAASDRMRTRLIAASASAGP